MFKLTRKNESGRSMIEMLGVLAIMGVLSVGGVTGYTVAMKNHEANQAVNQARQLAMMAASKRALDPNAYLSPSETGTQGKYVFTMDSEDKGKIKLKVSGLDPDVAKRVKDMNLGIADISEGEEGDPEGTLIFTFANDLREIPKNASGTTEEEEGENEVSGPKCAATTRVLAHLDAPDEEVGIDDVYEGDGTNIPSGYVIVVSAALPVANLGTNIEYGGYCFVCGADPENPHWLGPMWGECP